MKLDKKTKLKKHSEAMRIRRQQYREHGLVELRLGFGTPTELRHLKSALESLRCADPTIKGSENEQRTDAKPSLEISEKKLSTPPSSSIHDVCPTPPEAARCDQLISEGHAVEKPLSVKAVNTPTTLNDYVKGLFSQA
jgi:hypothetical protein